MQLVGAARRVPVLGALGPLAPHDRGGQALAVAHELRQVGGGVRPKVLGKAGDLQVWGVGGWAGSGIFRLERRAVTRANGSGWLCEEGAESIG